MVGVVGRTIRLWPVLGGVITPHQSAAASIVERSGKLKKGNQLQVLTGDFFFGFTATRARPETEKE
eukprot:scaffold120592_cov33-Tisochrysis_lutea.AAC.2